MDANETLEKLEKHPGEKRTAYLSSWYGHKISVLLPKCDMIFRLLDKVWVNEWINDEDYKYYRGQWEEAVDEYNNFLYSIAQLVEPQRKKEEKKYELSEAEKQELDVREQRRVKRKRKKEMVQFLKKIGKPKVFVLNTNMGLRFFKVIISTDQTFRMLQNMIMHEEVQFEHVKKIRDTFQERIRHMENVLAEISSAISQAEFKRMQAEGEL